MLAIVKLIMLTSYLHARSKGGGCGVGLGLGWGFGTAFGSQYRSSTLTFQGIEFSSNNQGADKELKD